jgi:uncharacterized protein YyaL (SSP411 family)
MNRLATEHSPYLLQHADNPVEWYPWGDDAFEKARREDRPIFLSIGYSTCHWCHVMAHESFENPDIAAILNRDFVSIKVDREERPDIDHVYMTFVQATTGSGGWPMSVWLTPDLKPFFGGTYFPPTAAWGRAGFPEVLTEIARVWKSERSNVQESAADIVQRLSAAQTTERGGQVPPAEMLTRAVAQFAAAFDHRRGGFGNAPKFPRTSELYFLLREHARTGDEGAEQMVLTTLRAMAIGGMRDHIGGGFHRYSVDADWRVPHFEKMLYDQAQLVLAYLEAAQNTGDPFFAEVAEDTLQYVRREMTDPGGGFYSAEDADSLPPEHAGDLHGHKMEGAFYLWREQEIEELLGPDADVVRQRYGIQPGGNAPHDPQGEFTGKNLLYLARSVEEVAQATGKTTEEVTDALARSRVVLFDARMHRPRPHLDDKVLTAWNGLMIAAFARGARVLPGRGAAAGSHAGVSHLVTAQTAAHFIRKTLWDAGTRTLLRRFRDGDAAIPGYAEDYAFLIWGLLELFQSDPDPEWLEWALALQARQDELFWDRESGGWFSTTGQDATVLLRIKEDYDGAEPSATSVSVCNLLTMVHLTGDAKAAERIEDALKGVTPKLPQLARAMPMMLMALSAYHAGMGQIAVVGPEDREDTRQLLDALQAVYQPFFVIVCVRPDSAQARLAQPLPWVAPLKMRDGRATAYVCRDFVCKEPVTSADALIGQLTF